MRKLLILVAALAVAGCGIGIRPSPDPTPYRPPTVAAAATPTPSPTERPSPSPTPWKLAVSNVTYTSQTFVGGDILVNAKVKNSGKAALPGLRVQLSDLTDYADIVGCKPACATTDSFGIYADFDGIAPGKTKAIKVVLVATAVGAAHWSICIYDSISGFGNQLWCGDAVTAIH